MMNQIVIYVNCKKHFHHPIVKCALNKFSFFWVVESWNVNHLQRKQRSSLVIRRKSFVIYLFARMKCNLEGVEIVNLIKKTLFILRLIEFDQAECNDICILNSITRNLFTSHRLILRVKNDDGKSDVTGKTRSEILLNDKKCFNKLSL